VDSCLRLLLQAITSYFEALGNVGDKSRKTTMLEQSTLMLASRYKSMSQDMEEDENGLPSQIEILGNVSKYLGEFTEFVCKCHPSTAEEHVRLLKTVHDALTVKDQIKKAVGMALLFYVYTSRSSACSNVDFLRCDV
jgi:hypothetical protein